MDIKFYHKNGTEISGVKFTEIKESAQDMGDRNITIDVQSPTPIDFQIGDYVEWRGEHFSLINEVSVKKIAYKKSYGGSFVYDNIVLKSVTDELVECPFSDRITDETDSTEHFTTMPSFSFVAHHLEDLALRLQACLDHMYGKNVWTITVDESYVDDPEYDDLTISVNNQSIWDGIAMCQSMYNSPFIVRGRTVTLGTRGRIANNYLQGDAIEYGKGKGAYQIERTAASDQKIVTRLTAWGNTTNMHPRYYSMVGAKIKGHLLAIYVESATRLSLYFEYSQSLMKHDCQFSVLGKTYRSTVETDINGVRYPINVSTTEASAICNYFGVSYSVGTKADVNSTNYVVFDYGVDKYNVKYANVIFPSNGMPEAMNVANLALPGFPLQSLQDWVNEHVDEYDWLSQAVDDGYEFSDDPLNPYIKSKNYSSLGDHPWTEMFTTADATHKDIYPSLDNNEDPDYNKIAKTSTEINGDAITSDGVYAGVSDIPNFKVYLPKNLGFELEDVDISGSNISVGIKNGACGGREFTCVQYKKTTDYWELECQRVRDDSLALYFPYVNGNIEQGVKFVLGNVWMDEAYINMASVKLLKWALIFLRKNDYTTFSYNVSIDEVAIKRSENKTGTNSFFMSVREGDYLFIKDDDLNFIGNIPISSLNITWKGGLPVYEITLQDTKTTGTIQKIQQQIDALTGGSGGISSGSIADIAYQALKDKFISRERDDNTPNNLEVGKTFTSQSTITHGNASIGGDITVVGDTKTTNINNSEKIVTKDLEVTGSAHFFELTIDKVNATYGQNILSPGAARIDYAIKYNDNSFALCYRKDDGEEMIATNRFAVGDLVKAQNFNTAKVGTSQSVGNTSIWLRVSEVGEITDDDGVEYWIFKTMPLVAANASKTNGAYYENSQVNGVKFTSATPTADDFVGLVFAVFGNISATSGRDGAILNSSLDDTFLAPTFEGILLQAPMSINFVGINSYTLTDDNYDNIEARNFKMSKGDFRVKSGDGHNYSLDTETKDRDIYNATTSTFVAPRANDSGWTKDLKQPTSAEPYLWKKTVFHYTSGDKTVIEFISRKGADGAIVIASEQYYTSTTTPELPETPTDEDGNPVAPNGNNWHVNINDVTYDETNRYLWRYTITFYSLDGGQTESPEVEMAMELMSVYGEQGEDSRSLALVTNNLEGLKTKEGSNKTGARFELSSPSSCTVKSVIGKLDTANLSNVSVKLGETSLANGATMTTEQKAAADGYYIQTNGSVTVTLNYVPAGEPYQYTGGSIYTPITSGNVLISGAVDGLACSISVPLTCDFSSKFGRFEHNEGRFLSELFGVDEDGVEYSKIEQTASNIELKVKDCGIDIDNSKISLTADKIDMTNSDGDIIALFTGDGVQARSMMCYDGSVLMTSLNRFAQGELIQYWATGRKKLEIVDGNIRYYENDDDNSIKWQIGDSGAVEEQVVEKLTACTFYTLVTPQNSQPTFSPHTFYLYSKGTTATYPEGDGKYFISGTTPNADTLATTNIYHTTQSKFAPAMVTTDGSMDNIKYQIRFFKLTKGVKTNSVTYYYDEDYKRVLVSDRGDLDVTE